jgi:hypothetical protein
MDFLLPKFLDISLDYEDGKDGRAQFAPPHMSTKHRLETERYIDMPGRAQ